MSRTLAIILLVIVGIYCLPGVLAIIGTVFGLVVGLAGALLGMGISLAVTLLPIIIVGYLVWWLIRDNRRSRQH